MGSSSQKTSSYSVGPGKAEIASLAPGRAESFYQADMNNPNRLAPQAQGYLGGVLQGNYLDPSSNPHLGALTGAIKEQVFPAVSSVFSRAGRGTSANNSGLAGALTRGMGSALAQPLFAQYNQERGLQHGAAGMAPAIDAVQSLPYDQWLERNMTTATMDKKGKTTTSGSPLQTIAGLGLSAAGLFGGNGLWSKGGIFGT